MKKIIAIIGLALSMNAFGQKEWKENELYKYRGDDVRKCDTTVYEKHSKNSYGNNVVTGYYMKCKVLRWDMETRTGNVKVWSNNKWAEEWIDGDCWMCYWDNIEVKL
jgi:hypothetical protein